MTDPHASDTPGDASRPDPIRSARAEAEGAGVGPGELAPAGDTLGTGPLGEQPGDRIGRYKLLEEIGQGGMGSVWMVEQSEPVRRKVALKIIKLGMDTHEVVVRFEAERQALALMDHPHIAKVFDGGATGSGRPYFVMELVDGTPITDYCDAASAGLRERLELFVKVCEAVQHAHQKGVIHRDIKPSNVLVTLHDGVPVPKVIDFGIAKATSAELTHKTLFTQHAQILGTPEYMAPEQAERSGLDIDTRADVYSLGVLLYELLTGCRPFDIREVLERGYDELLRTIREDDPVRPSTRVSTSANASPIALRRNVNVDTLSRRLRGDLDWVAMKALEKDRTRRYETASSFGADVERYLRDEPVVAAPPSAGYRLRKFVRRRRKTVAAAATIALLLVAGSIGTGVGWWNTKRANAALEDALGEKDEALAEKGEALAEEARQRVLAEANEERAAEAEVEALARADELEQVALFQSAQLAELNPEVMGARLRRSLLDASPEERRAVLTESLAGVNFTNLALQSLEENIFQRTIQAIDAQFEELPLVRGRLLQSTASTMRTLGLLSAASDPTRRALDIRRAALGDDHTDTISAIGNWASQLWAEGRLEEAELYRREAHEGWRRVLGAEHHETLKSLGSLGLVLMDQGRYEESEAPLTEALEGMRRKLGDEDPSTLRLLYNLGVQRFYTGRLDEAEALFQEALEGRRRVLGDDHKHTVKSVGSLAAVYFERGNYAQFERGNFAQAEQLFSEALEAQRRLSGDDHPDTLSTIKNLAAVRQTMGRLDEAESLYREAIEGMRRVRGDDHPSTLGALDGMGFLLQDKLKAARRRGEQRPLASALTALGANELLQGAAATAESTFAEALEVLDNAGAEEGQVQRALNDLGASIAAQGRHAEAEALLGGSAEWMLDHPTDPAAGTALQRMVELFETWSATEPGQGHEARATEWRTELEAWRAEHGTDAE